MVNRKTRSALEPFWQLLTVTVLAWGTVAGAGERTITVTGDDGAPLKYAVAYVESPSLAEKAAQGERPDVKIDQRDQQFSPHSAVLQRRSSVEFPNHDDTRHHVYSFSSTKRFELPLFGDETPRPIVFEDTGVVVLGCNIHDHMLGYLLIVDTPVFANADADGHIELKGVPDDEDAVMRVWHPGLGDDSVGERVDHSEDQTISVSLSVVDEPPPEPTGLRDRRRNIEGRFGGGD